MAVPKGHWDFDAYLGRLDVHEQQRLLSRGPDTVAEPGGGAPGPRELHVPAAPVGGRRCDVVPRGQLDYRRRRSERIVEQLATGRDRLISHGTATVVEGFLQLRHGGPHRDELQDARRGVPVATIHQALASPIASRLTVEPPSPRAPATKARRGRPNKRLRHLGASPLRWSRPGVTATRPHRTESVNSFQLRRLRVGAARSALGTARALPTEPRLPARHVDS